MTNKGSNTFTWADQALINKIIETTKQIRVIDENSWKDAGLDKEPVALHVLLKDNSYDYFLNYYAIEIIKTLLDSWRIPTTEEWSTLSETKVKELKKELTGSISPFGERVSIDFSTGYWTNNLQGERHAFVAVLTNLNNTVYNKSFPLTEGYRLKLVKVS